MRYFLIFIGLFGLLYAGADVGDFPTWKDLGMAKKDYFFSCSLTGILSASIFGFLITR